MNGQAKFGVGITANDNTARGVTAAINRLKTVPKAANKVSGAVEQTKRAMDQLGSQRTRSAVSSLGRTFAEVERASARALGNRSSIGGIVSGLSAVRVAGAAAGVGLGEAAIGGGALAAALGPVGIGIAVVTATMTAAAFAAFKFADGWAKGAASLGRTAAIIGVTTKGLTEFTAAAERAGIDKGAAAGGLGGLSQTLNDARYGRNRDAQALLAKLGVGIRTQADGSVDVEKMLSEIADALSRQNSSGRRTVARGLGMSEAMIPLFSRGGASLKANMDDAAKHAAVLDDDDVRLGKRVTRKSVMVSQLAERAKSNVGRYAAEKTEASFKAAVDGGRALTDGSRNFDHVVRDNFRPAVEKLDRAATGLIKAVQAGVIRATGQRAGRLSPSAVVSEAQKGVRLRDKLMQSGFNRSDANALAANAVRESGANYRARQPGGGGRGLWQWDGVRKTQFRQQMGTSVEDSTENQQIAFLKWEIANTERKSWERAHQYGRDSGSIAYGITKEFERPAEKERDGTERRAVANALDMTIPVKVEIEARGLPSGTKTKVTAGHGNHPAVSYSYTPVHGG